MTATDVVHTLCESLILLVSGNVSLVIMGHPQLPCIQNSTRLSPCQPSSCMVRFPYNYNNVPIVLPQLRKYYRLTNNSVQADTSLRSDYVAACCICWTCACLGGKQGDRISVVLTVANVENPKLWDVDDFQRSCERLDSCWNALHLFTIGSSPDCRKYRL